MIWGSRTEALRDSKKNGNWKLQEIGYGKGAGLKNIPESWDVGASQDSKGKRLYEMPFNGDIVLVETTWYMLPGYHSSV